MVIEDDFLNSFLVRSLGNDQFKVFPLAGDASNRRYYRIVVDSLSCVLMRWEPFNPNKYPFLSVLNHFAKNGVDVPEVIAMSPDEGLVLLEDLGDLTLERKFWENQNQESSLIFYKMAIDQLIQIHHTATLNKADCTAFDIQFDTEKFLWEMNYGKDNLITGVLDYSLSPKVDEELASIFKNICEKLHHEPKRIAHRDYHSRNLMLKLEQMHVIDFQDARLGPIQYDLVSLLKDSYVDLNPESCQILLQDYLEKSKPYLRADFSKNHFDYIYELQSIQRCFKACGSFASFYKMRGDKRYLKYISGTLKKVMSSLIHFPEYKTFTDILLDSGSLNKNYESL
ncbi:MAG: aminoglycoside phosphotransferase family protein [Pseudobdellovibrionaceae bacterium]